MSPVCITQLSCEVLLGIKSAWYVEYLRTHPEFPRRKLGQLILTTPSDWLGLIESAPVAESEGDVHVGHEQPSDVHAVLRRLGMRRTA